MAEAISRLHGRPIVPTRDAPRVAPAATPWRNLAMRHLSHVLLLGLAACGSKAKAPDPYAPRPDDVPQVLTCCVTPREGDTPLYETIPESRCPEEHRNPVDACDLGPGDLPRTQ